MSSVIACPFGAGDVSLALDRAGRNGFADVHACRRPGACLRFGYVVGGLDEVTGTVVGGGVVVAGGGGVVVRGGAAVVGTGTATGNVVGGGAVDGALDGAALLGGDDVELVVGTVVDVALVVVTVVAGVVLPLSWESASTRPIASRATPAVTAAMIHGRRRGGRGCDDRRQLRRRDRGRGGGRHRSRYGRIRDRRREARIGNDSGRHHRCRRSREDERDGDGVAAGRARHAAGQLFLDRIDAAFLGLRVEVGGERRRPIRIRGRVTEAGDDEDQRDFGRGAVDGRVPEVRLRVGECE